MKSKFLLVYCAFISIGYCSIAASKTTSIGLHARDTSLSPRTSDTKTHMNIESSENSGKDSPRQPATVPFSDEQRLYLATLIKGMIEVVLQEKKVDENDGFFGTGSYFVPKDPSAPERSSLTFRANNFKFRSITIGFRRQDAHQGWNKAVMSVHPSSFPRRVFDMSLASSYFSKFRLEKAYAEKREYEDFDDVHVYCYSFSQGSDKLSLKFTARPDVSQLNEGHPRSFHHLIVERGSCV